MGIVSSFCRNCLLDTKIHQQMDTIRMQNGTKGREEPAIKKFGHNLWMIKDMIESPVVLSGINLPTTDPTLGTQKSYPSALQAGGGALGGRPGKVACPPKAAPCPRIFFRIKAGWMKIKKTLLVKKHYFLAVYKKSSSSSIWTTTTIDRGLLCGGNSKTLLESAATLHCWLLCFTQSAK